MAVNRLDFDATRGAPFIKRVIGRFFKGYGSRLENAVADGSKQGVQDVMDEWRRESTDIAPLKTGTLRRSISTGVTKQGGKWVGEISASAIEVKGKRKFDYATYLNDVYPKKHGDSFRNPTTPGTVPGFLDKPAEENEREWQRTIEAEIKAAIKRKGL